MFSGVDSSSSAGGACGQMVSWASGMGPQSGCLNLIQTDPQPVAQKPWSWGSTSSGLQRERHRKETLSDFKTHKT